MCIFSASISFFDIKTHALALKSTSIRAWFQQTSRVLLSVLWDETRQNKRIVMYVLVCICHVSFVIIIFMSFVSYFCLPAFYIRCRLFCFVLPLNLTMAKWFMYIEHRYFFFLLKRIHAWNTICECVWPECNRVKMRAIKCIPIFTCGSRIQYE